MSILSAAAVARLDRYADLIVRVGANVQPGQTLFVNAALEHAELVRALTRSGYRAGAAYVDVRYADQHLRRAMIELGPDEELAASPPWAVERAAALDGNAIAMIAGESEPELLADLDQDRVGRARPIEMVKQMLEIQNRRGVNWTIAAFPSAGWAEQIFGEPDVERLWEAIAATVRLDEADPGGGVAEAHCSPPCALRRARRARARRAALRRAWHQPDGRAPARIPLGRRRHRHGRRHRARAQPADRGGLHDARLPSRRREPCARPDRSRWAGRSSATSP